MAEFNPDEYLKEKEQDEFNPDQYLAEQTPQEMSLVEGAARTLTKALPMVGSIGGGLIAGGPTLGAGALGGSALGAMAGKAVQNLIEQNFFPEEPKKDLQEQVLDLPKEAVYDVAGNLVGGGIIGPTVGALAKPLAKAASALSGVPEKVIETYAKNMNQVNAIDDIALEADKIRESAQRAIKSFENTQNKQIANAIAQKAETPVDMTNAITFLEQRAAAKNTKINPELIAEIEKQKEIMKSISVFDETTGKYTATAKDAAEMKSRLQELAQYEEVGKTFQKKDYGGMSMAGAARELRRDVNRVLPEYAQANLELAKLRRMEGKFNKNLITPEKPINAITSVGSGQNPMMEKQVQRLGDIVGQDLLSPMQNLAAAQKLGAADYISGMTTGRATIPFLTGGIANTLGGPVAGGLSFIAATPVGVKTAIQVGNASKKIGLTPSRIGAETIQAYGPEIKDVLSTIMNYSPYDREQFIRNDRSLKPSEKAQLLKENKYIDQRVKPIGQ